jgi:hypothetical protein
LTVCPAGKVLNCATTILRDHNTGEVMSDVLLSLPLPVLLALIGAVLGMLVLARALVGLRKPAVVREAAEHEPRLRLVSGAGHHYEDREGA